MNNSFTALRCPVLSCKQPSQDPSSHEEIRYEADALIILDDGKIIDFGPADKLQSKLPEDAKIELKQECRIIKSVLT